MKKPSCLYLLSLFSLILISCNNNENKNSSLITLTSSNLESSIISSVNVQSSSQCPSEYESILSSNSSMNSSRPAIIDDQYWENGFKGCIRIGGEGRCTADYIDNVDPGSTLNRQLFAVFNNNVSDISAVGRSDRYDMTLSYEFAVENGTGNVEDYFEYRLNNNDKTVIFFKNFPSEYSSPNEWPIIHVTATGEIEDQQRTKNYSLRLNGYNQTFQKMTISEIYAPQSNCFDWMKDNFVSRMHPTAEAYAYGPDVNKYDSWWQNTDDNEVHANIETYGYITYISPDKNNAILECGNQAIQLHKVNEYLGWEFTSDVLMNCPVVVRGELYSGFGNIQVSRICEIFPAPSNMSVTQPTTPTEFNEAMISNIKWSENPLFNKVVKVTSVKFYGNVHEIQNGSAPNPTEVGDEITGVGLDSVNFLIHRYEFDVLIGSTILTIQTDYHIVQRYQELANSLKAIVKKNIGDNIKIGGTIRWLNDRTIAPGSDETTRKDGKWEIVPYLPEHASSS